ncbi:protein stum isoform X1 [Osmia bicornis bicornis]|uniref:protein stum isoform X1 n=2 Tax=Osmia bicornis bicornis TaxID=1437191 RepID=UPI001EAED7FC|nr:protein stum isoform X1 [Osmia bicornis bicornis]
MSVDAMQLFRGPPTWRTSSRCVRIVRSGWRLDRRYFCESDNGSRRASHSGGLHEGLELWGLERMRRIDDGHVARPPPFRVLAAPDGNYLSPPTIPPPPPRAPEPYKVAPSSTSSSRAHRRSSFVIIADSRPVSPEARTPSPTLAAGRVSPFRGRGFKGPPPRSRSRPQSPEAGDGRRRGRIDRRVSVSQQSSPRRSLIPQPTRQRSTSLSKSTERLSSPKLGRRVDSRGRLNAADSRNRLNAYGNSNSKTNLATRRQVSKTPSKLSPIQGTPTKPEKTPQTTRRDRFKETAKTSPTKTQKVFVSPAKNLKNSRRVNQEKNSTAGRTTSKERVTSPSKIPLKTNRVSTNNLNPARFITINQPNEKNKKPVDKGQKDGRTSNEQTNDTNQSGKQPEAGQKESQTSEKNSNTEQTGELNLIDLLRQTSTATGTSSMVNTTATTAVQPLHIDANTVLLEKDSSDKKSLNPEKKNQSDPSSGKSSNSSNEDVGKQNASDDQRPNPQKASKPNSNHNRTKGGTENRTDSPVPSESIGHSKNSSISQSLKNVGKVNSATTGSAKNRSQNDQTVKTSRSNDQKIEESNSMKSQPASNSVKSNEIESNDFIKNHSSNGTHRTVVSIGSAGGDVKAAPRSANDSETKSATNSSSAMKNNSEQNNVSVTVGAVNDDRKNVNSSGVKPRAGNHGSGMSVKSSAGVSVDSIESVRSTDTGVSVDTVKGVSSPREKTGMHVVKRAQEIETLSGNVVHLEQNGEPAVLAAANGVGERPPEKLFTRWKRSWDRCGECCRSMRCLACRTNPKGLAWPGKHSRITTLTNRNEQLPANNASDNAPVGCWPKFKDRCRCKRLRDMKCCSRKSRIAPAEASVCCPPERKFGAICRRLFDSCKCKRNAEVERTRNIRAKHSLTSVAPPPLSEEPKAKIPDVLVEHNSLMRGAIPCLPVPLAWFCLVWNVLLPGSGTVWSGIFNLCTGQPRFSSVAGVKSRLGAFVVNLMVGVGQLFTVLFCLVGWGWSIWWGVTLVRLARKYKRFKASEAALNDPEARGGEPAAMPPGVPSHALRGTERTR